MIWLNWVKQARGELSQVLPYWTNINLEGAGGEGEAELTHWYQMMYSAEYQCKDTSLPLKHVLEDHMMKNTKIHFLSPSHLMTEMIMICIIHWNKNKKNKHLKTNVLEAEMSKKLSIYSNYPFTTIYSRSYIGRKLDT